VKVKLATGLLVPVLFALVTGCGGGGDGGNKVASVNSGAPTSEQPKGEQAGSGVDEDKMRQFAKCMRDNGIDMPDPEQGGVGVRIQAQGEGSVDMEKMNKAQEACKQHLPNGGEMREMTPEEKDKMRADAKCMREHGVDWPDPDSTTTGEGKSDTKTPAFDDTEKFKQAMKDCGMGDGGSMVAVPAAPNG
jgi:hypothetical protein